MFSGNYRLLRVLSGKGVRVRELEARLRDPQSGTGVGALRQVGPDHFPGIEDLSGYNQKLDTLLVSRLPPRKFEF